MKACSGIYGWQGGRNPPQPKPECTKKVHAGLINRSAEMMCDARAEAYRWYCKECRAWGREPEDETTWFMHANGACSRIRKGHVDG